MTIPQVAVLLTAGCACACDLQTRRIPNVLTFGAAAAAIVFQFANSGTSGLALGLSGWFIGIALLLVPFALGGIGGGDVKLLGSLGAWLGPSDILRLMLYTGVAGAAIALVVALAYGYLPQACRNIWLLMVHWRVVGFRAMPGLTLDGSHGPRLAYAVPILIGTIVTLWLR